MHKNVMIYFDSKVVIDLNSRYQAIEEIKKLNPFKICLITDVNVVRHHKKFISELSSELDLEDVLIIKEGEESKSINTVVEIWKKLFELGFTRKSLVIAFGGGVVIDIAGFVSSTYMRGIDYINIPTTLLSQSDSSIGGKTGIDFYIKNGVGTFYLPKSTYIDPYFLTTLPDKEIKNGFSEIIKHALINRNGLINILLQNNLREIISDASLMLKVIRLSVETKLNIITRDFRESNIRQFLNLGHTIGHALEKISDYKIPHGYAVASGISIESYISRFIHGFKEYDRVRYIIQKFGLPTYIPYSPEKLISEIKKDKKNWRGKITLTLLKEIGRPEITEVDEKTILEIMRGYS